MRGQGGPKGIKWGLGGNEVREFVSGWVNDWGIGRVSEMLGDSFGKRVIETFGYRLAEMLGKGIRKGNG
jgi:hypothetical protein